MTNLLEASVVSMQYPGQKIPGNLIENISFVVPEKSFVSFLGPSGAGKTTLLKIIAGLEKRFEGKIVLNNESITKPTRKIQMVFQDSRLIPWKTVGGNIKFAANKYNSGNIDDHVNKSLESVLLRDKRDVFPKTLSGGEESRAALARVIVNPPLLLLLDEPFRNLDVHTKFDVQKHLISIVQKTNVTAIQVSHSIEDAVFLSDTIFCVSARPMTITKIFHIDIPRPRQRNDTRLWELLEKIQDFLLGEVD